MRITSIACLAEYSFLPPEDEVVVPYLLDPHVAGELGEGTVVDASASPPRVDFVDYVLDAPDPDDLIQAFPVILVSESVAERMLNAHLRGFEFGDATIRGGDNYQALGGQASPQPFKRLHVNGRGHLDDCWLTGDYRLCVSDNMMDVLRSARLSFCLIEEID